MYLSGTPVRDIANHFGVTMAGVYESLKRQGIEPNRLPRKPSIGHPPIPKGKKMWIRRLHMRGMSQLDIAHKLKLSLTTVRKYLVDYGLLEVEKRQPKAPVDKQGGMMTAQIVYVSRPWWRRVIDWFRG